MRISGTIQDSIVDGPGLRYVIFTQGCEHNCKGCHNPATHARDGGREVDKEAIVEEMLSNPLTDGLTLSGGEPFLQPEDCGFIAKKAHENRLNVWCYTGFTFEKLLTMPKVMVLLSEIDVLVDGLFILEQKKLILKWRGSENQRILDVKKSLESGSAVELDF